MVAGRHSSALNSARTSRRVLALRMGFFIGALSGALVAGGVRLAQASHCDFHVLTSELLIGILCIFDHDPAAHAQALYRVRPNLPRQLADTLTREQTSRAVATARRPSRRAQRAPAGGDTHSHPPVPRPVHAEMERGPAGPLHDRPQSRRNRQETIPLIMLVHIPWSFAAVSTYRRVAFVQRE